MGKRIAHPQIQEHSKSGTLVIKDPFSIYHVVSGHGNHDK